MWHLVAAGILTGAVAVALHMIAPTPVYACSAGPDFDPIATSDVIVEGRFLDWELAPELNRGDAYLGIRVEMAVQRVWKGQVAGEVITMSDSASLGPPYPGHDEYEWVGSGGGCGAFDADPTGFYAIMGLSQTDDGTLRSNRLRVFYLGEDAGGEEYNAALQRMASYPGAAALPALGSGPGASGRGATLTVAGIMAMMGTALLSLVVLSRIRIRRST